MSEDLIGLIPAAGRGLRLGLPYPKELYPIIRQNRYKPVSQFVVENLTSSGIEHIVFVINASKHQLIAYYGDGSRFGCHISYVVQEAREQNHLSTSPGLAHALNSAYHLVRGKTVCFGMADTIMQPNKNFQHVISVGHENADVMLGLYPTDQPEKFGMVRLGDKGRVLQIIDKPTHTDLTHMWGFMVWRPLFTEHLRNCVLNRDVFDFAVVMNIAIEEGMDIRGVVIPQGSYLDVGTYDDIERLEKKFRAP